MTNQHPLTDEMCEILSRQPWLQPDVDVEGTIYDMRAAADWQLEQVIRWLYDNLYWVEEDGSLRYLSGEMVSIDHHQIIDDLKEEMRPQEDTP